MSDEAKMEPWRSDAERRDCYCAAQRKPCSYHEGYADGWDAGTDAVLAVVRGVDADQWEQHKHDAAVECLYWFFRMVKAGGPDGSDMDFAVVEDAEVAAALLAPWIDARSPVDPMPARRVVPVVPSPEPAEELLCHPGTPCSARCDRCCPAGYCKNCGKPMSGHGPLANCYPVASPDRCPTCGSTDRAVWITGTPQNPDRERCSDPWHRVPSTEPKEGL